MTDTIPSTTKCYVFTTHGYVLVLFILLYSNPLDSLHLEEKPIPTPSPTQVLLRVHAVALNPAGYKTMKDMPSIAVKKPAIPELDVAGTIMAVGTDVQRWHPGDKVFGIIPGSDMFRRQLGGLSEYTLLHQDNMSSSFSNSTLMCSCSKPDFLSWEEACGGRLDH